MLKFAMAVRLKGMASADALAEVTALSMQEVNTSLAALVAADHAQETPRGYKLTPAGHTWVDVELSVERAGIDADAMNQVYADFCRYNVTFKQLVTDWQLRDVEGQPELNDHSDLDYDAAVLERLDQLDAGVAQVFSAAQSLAPRLERYRQRLGAALAAVRAGDSSMLASPLKDSYHTVWFEMHEELILLTGRTRAEEAASGHDA